MKVLIDTHVLVWALNGDDRLNEKARSIILNPENTIYYSVASIWEWSIKSRLKNLSPASGIVLSDCCEKAGYISLPINKEHVKTLEMLHYRGDVPTRKDPFDRILISQAKHENMLFLTHDKLLTNYSEPCVELV